MSFQEAEPQKTTVIADIGGEGSDVREIANRPGRPLVEMTGTVEDIEKRAAGGKLDDCILRATVTSATRIYDLSERVYGASPKYGSTSSSTGSENAERRAITDEDDGDEPEGRIEDLSAGGARHGSEPSGRTTRRPAPCSQRRSATDRQPARRTSGPGSSRRSSTTCGPGPPRRPSRARRLQDAAEPGRRPSSSNRDPEAPAAAGERHRPTPAETGPSPGSRS